MWSRLGPSFSAASNPGSDPPRLWRRGGRGIPKSAPSRASGGMLDPHSRVHGGWMQQGLHETVVTLGLERQLSREVALAPGYGAVDDADLSHVLLRHMDGVLARRLEAIRDPAHRLAFVNQLLLS